jgi:acyl carrier protein
MIIKPCALPPAYCLGGGYIKFTSLMRNVRMTVTADLHRKVTSVLAEVLAVDEGAVSPAASLQRDLGADSLDLLEIMFRLEQEFGIEIPRGELWPESNFRIRPEWIQDGKLTDNGLAELHAILPFADLRRLQAGQELGAIADLFTVDMVDAYLQWKLSGNKWPAAPAAKRNEIVGVTT